MSDDLLEVTDKPIIPEEVISRVKGYNCGAIITFIGRVRPYSRDRRVISLEHEIPENGEETLLKVIASELREKWILGEIAFCYRTGPVLPEEPTVVIVVSSVRRQEAFAACQYAIDRFKQIATAREILEDGED